MFDDVFVLFLHLVILATYLFTQWVEYNQLNQQYIYVLSKDSILKKTMQSFPPETIHTNHSSSRTELCDTVHLLTYYKNHLQFEKEYFIEKRHSYRKIQEWLDRVGSLPFCRHFMDHEYSEYASSYYN